MGAAAGCFASTLYLAFTPGFNTVLRRANYLCDKNLDGARVTWNYFWNLLYSHRKLFGTLPLNIAFEAATPGTPLTEKETGRLITLDNKTVLVGSEEHRLLTLDPKYAAQQGLVKNFYFDPAVPFCDVPSSSHLVIGESVLDGQIPSVEYLAWRQAHGSDSSDDNDSDTESFDTDH